MILLSLLSGTLLVLPIAVTIGVYIGVEHQQLFNQDHGGGLFGTGRVKLTTERYCQKFNGITPDPGRYTFNPNQWGDPDNTGDLCINVTTSNVVEADDLYAAGYSATWQYPPGPPEEPVHAFPNAKLELNGSMPARIGDIQTMPVDVAWTYGLGDYVHNSTDHASLVASRLNANVAIDMFLSDNKAEAANTTAADYEVMLWLGRWGEATVPIGFLQGSQANLAVNGTRFDLYSGENSLGQQVHTWVAERNTTSFSGDILPLLDRLAENDGPDAGAYIGYLAFGTEALYSFENVTFYCPTLEMDITF